MSRNLFWTEAFIDYYIAVIILRRYDKSTRIMILKSQQ